MIFAREAPIKTYVKGVSVNGVPLSLPVIRHNQFATGGEIAFVMSGRAEPWGQSDLDDSPRKADWQPADQGRLRTEL